MRRILSVLAVAALLLTVSAAPVPAKGPSHLLVVAPLSGAYQFMELSESRAQEVEVLLGDLGEKVTEPVYEEWHEVQVAWTMHAFEIWRSDIVFVDGNGEAVVMTVRSMLEGEGYTTDWRRVRNGEALTELFDELGLMGKRAVDRSADTESSDVAPAGFEGAGTPSAPSSADTSDDSSGWRWALPGLAVGLLLGVAGAGLLWRRSGQVLAQRLASS